MVRKMTAVFLLALVGLAALPQAASAAGYIPYEGSISTTYAQIGRDIVSKVPPFEDYVFFRAGQYEYYLVVGDLSYNDVSFSGGSCTLYKIAVYSGDMAYQTEEITDFLLEPGISLVYSNLGLYPDLVDGSQRYTFACVFLLVVALCIFLIRPIFGFVLRRR